MRPIRSDIEHAAGPASLVLYKETVIVNASEESQSIRALDKATGQEVWIASAASLEHLYWVNDRGQAFCVEAKSGDLVYHERLRSVSSGGRPFYASPILVSDKRYVVSRRGGTFVFAAKPEFEQIAQNRFISDETSD